MKVWIPRRSANRYRSPLKYDSVSTIFSCYPVNLMLLIE